ncbi:MAG: serpin family protein [Anaerolineae bacterium]
MKTVMLRKRDAATVMLLLSLFISACESPVTPEPPTEGNVKVAAAEIQRETNPDVAADDLSSAAMGQNAFAFDLYQAIRESDENLFYSPYSISVALAMTYAGTQGDTAQQMAEVLHYELPQDRLHPAMNALAQSLTNQEGLTLTVANSLWAQGDYAFLDAFLETLARNYGAGVRIVDYVDPVAREEARQAINDWVLDETDGKVEELILEDMLTDLTRLVLANAIAFEADWEDPFRHGTEDDTFYLPDGTEVTVPMMARRATTLHAETERYQAVDLPYKGDRMHMMVLVPAEGEFEEIEAELDAGLAQTLIDSTEAKDVKLYMPKFSYDARLALKDILIDLGMIDAFDPDLADLSGMDGTTRLYISHVAHKAFVSVDEEGTEAAAATGVVVAEESMPLMVRVERPFIYFIYDTELDVILFVGRVLNPAMSG